MAAAIALIVLIGMVALLATNTITSTVAGQFRTQEQQLVGSLARQLEFFFDTRSSVLLSLASYPEVQSTAAEQAAALAVFAETGEPRAQTLRSIVRLTAEGVARYAWPPEVNARIQANQRLDWTISRAAIQDLITAGGVLFRVLPGVDRLTFLLATAVDMPGGSRELLAFDLDLEGWFQDNFGPLELGSSGQLWVFDSFGRLLYQGSATSVDWAATTDLSIPLLLAAEGTEVLEYDSVDGRRQAAFAPATSYGMSFVVVLTRFVSESQLQVQRQLNQLLTVTIIAVLLVAVVSWVMLWRLLRESRHRQQAEQRRQVARSLLVIARAVNSSLDLAEVLEQILAGLGRLLVHDSASIMLHTGGDQLEMVALSGKSGQQERTFSLDEMSAAAEVMQTGQPVLMPDCLSDPRWQDLPGSLIRSWLGVPLRVQDETVGVLNINSYVVNGFLPDAIEVAQAFADQAGVAIINARLHAERIHYYEQELANARDIQTSLLPQEHVRLPELEVVGRSLPARVVSGDFFQYLPRLDGRFAVAVGDVTGTGMPAALLMAVLTTALRRELERESSVAALFDHLNQSLAERMQSRHMNSALVMAVFDPQTRQVEVANAGMVQPYLRQGQDDWQLVPVGGYPLGASTQRQYSARRITLAPGAALLLMSDGVVEAQNAQGEFFGFERLESLLATMPHTMNGEAIIAAVLNAVYRHIGDQEAQDDITLVVMRSLVVPVPDREAAMRREAVHAT